nr:hypothetical protein [Tanacetum cinerariifolium]
MDETEGNNSLALMLFESPLEVEPLNMVEFFVGSAINDWSDDGVVPDLSLGIHAPAISTDVLPTYDRAAQDEIIPNWGLTIWSENQALMGANEELRSLLREMRMKESDALRMCDDLKDVIQTRDTQCSTRMNENDCLRYERRRIVSEISALEEEVNRLRSGQSLGTHAPAINTDVLPTYGRAAQDEIIPNLGLTIWSENQALMGANEELCSLLREMRMRESDALRLCDDLQDVVQTRDIQCPTCMNENDRLASEISALEEEVIAYAAASRHVIVVRQCLAVVIARTWTSTSVRQIFTCYAYGGYK